MIAAWMLYAVLVSAIIALAAAAGELAARAWRLPARFVWLAALVASAALSGMRLSTTYDVDAGFPSADSLAATTPVAGTAANEPPSAQGIERRSRFAAVRTIATPAWLSVLDTPLIVLWIAASLAWLGALLRSAARLRHARAGWRTVAMDGVPVRVSPAVGPALYGLINHEVVVPEWVLALTTAQRRLVLDHEREHARARDPLLLLAAALMLVLQPWNAAAWFMLRRVRRAVEADCDARVVSVQAGVRAYAELLLHVGERMVGPPLSVPALSEGRSLLSHRIRLMTQTASCSPRARAIPLAIATALTLAACQLPRPAEHRSPATGSRPAASAITTPTGERTVAHVTSAGLEDAGLSPTVLVFTDGPARVGIGSATPALLPDTLRLTALPVMRLDVTEGDVHLKLVDGIGRVRIAAHVTGGGATGFTANGRHVVVMKGGVGVRAGERMAEGDEPQ